MSDVVATRLTSAKPSAFAAVAKRRYGATTAGVAWVSAYNTIAAKAKQKCLTHYEHAAKELEKFYPEDQATVNI